MCGEPVGLVDRAVDTVLFFFLSRISQLGTYMAQLNYPQRRAGGSKPPSP